MQRTDRAHLTGHAQLETSNLPSAGARPKFDAYESITSRIIQILEAGTVPWQSPSTARVGFPRNLSTGKYYSGINVFLLGSQEFQSPYFLTFVQARELGGFVKKGETGFPVIKVGTWNKEADKENPEAGGQESTIENRRFLRLYTVFNVCQVEGIEAPALPKCESFTESAMAANARAIVEAMPYPPRIFEGRKAYPHYVPDTDTIEMPSRATFRAEWRFYKTLFHELVHATGHASRLNRESLTENRGRFAVGEEQKIYCLEELVAEMGAAFLGAHACIVEDGFANSAAYLKGWLDVLKVRDHKSWLIRAASEAQKASELILGTVDPDGANK